MAIRDLIPWRRRGRGAVAHRDDLDPFRSLQEEMNRLFDRFMGQFGMSRFGEWETPSGGPFAPSVDLAETDDEVRVSAELPGLESKDIEISVSGNSLTLKGEKKEEREEKQGTTYRSERYYGSFSRVIPLPCEVDADKAEATYKNGVLTVTLPKPEEARKSRKKISIKCS